MSTRKTPGVGGQFVKDAKSGRISTAPKIKPKSEPPSGSKPAENAEQDKDK